MWDWHHLTTFPKMARIIFCIEPVALKSPAICPSLLHQQILFNTKLWVGHRLQQAWFRSRSGLENISCACCVKSPSWWDEQKKMRRCFTTSCCVSVKHTIKQMNFRPPVGLLGRLLDWFLSSVYVDWRPHEAVELFSCWILFNDTPEITGENIFWEISERKDRRVDLMTPRPRPKVPEPPN